MTATTTWWAPAAGTRAAAVRDTLRVLVIAAAVAAFVLTCAAIDLGLDVLLGGDPR